MFASVRYYDAHNHLQDERLAGQLQSVLLACEKVNVARMVVNGTQESDWPRVLDLARDHPVVLPSFGCHPWFVGNRSSRWLDELQRHLDAAGYAAIGEIGLDRWMNHPDLPRQEEMFRLQLRIGAERNLPVSIHCLKAWGRLAEILREEPRPSRGFLLHSYGGPAEMIPGFAKLGACFGLSGGFAHARKAQQREAFKQVPADRLLIETDAPDMALPTGLNRRPLADPESGESLNHPANITAVHQFAANFLARDPDDLARQSEANFLRLFARSPSA